jgi:hypothetical protein
LIESEAVVERCCQAIEKILSNETFTQLSPLMLKSQWYQVVIVEPTIQLTFESSILDHRSLHLNLPLHGKRQSAMLQFKRFISRFEFSKLQANPIAVFAEMRFWHYRRSRMMAPFTSSLVSQELHESGAIVLGKMLHRSLLKNILRL